ncbi:hypothetical protein [Streptomyces sp. NPDC005336]|uniref:hypothetical protein n=1 Tax=unclassified Streptomyces TaxID=2593676 RepID=UPI0033B11974
MNKSGARRAVLAAAAVITALGLTAGCGGDSGDGKSDSAKSGGKNGDKAASSAPAAQPLSASALQRAALAKGEVKGFEIQKMTEKEFSDGGEAKAAKPACQPLAALMGSRFDPAPKAGVYRMYAGSGSAAKVGGSGLFRVSSYGPGDAEKTVKDIRDAVTACQDGFEAKDGSGEKSDVAKVSSLDAPKLGDEAVAYSLLDGGKEKAVIKFTVVRSGPQLTVFFGVNLADPTTSEIPQELLSAQVAKVEKAARS